jgi:serine/threonine-protein kinase
MALKLLRPELSSVPYVVQRFHREARFVSQLDDPRIVRVIDFGRAENGSLFLVMELIEGEPLSQRMHDHNAMELDDAMRVIEQVLLGLDHAHKNNVIHRDLKPDNIMLIQRGLDLQVKIVDFGIAKLASADGQTRAATLTQAGMVFGSPRYMSPEQASGDVVDARTDIYAAGVIVYELLTGRRPFDGKSARAILSAALTQPAPPMNLTRPNKRVGQAIENVVLTALAKEKEQRYPSAGALLEALRGALKA